MVTSVRHASRRWLVCILTIVGFATAGQICPAQDVDIPVISPGVESSGAEHDEPVPATEFFTEFPLEEEQSASVEASAPEQPNPSSSLPASTADDNDDSDPQVEEASFTASQFQDVLTRLDALEKEFDKSAPDKKPPEKKADDKDKKDDKDGWIDLSTEKWNVRLGGHIQGDYVNWIDPDPAIDTRPGTMNYFEFRRLRLLADGLGYGVYEFRLQIDIEPEAESEDQINTPFTAVKDAYLSIMETEYMGKVRFGNFFVPFSLEQVTNDTNNIFLERSIPTAGVFAADREVGMASYNYNDEKNFSWTYGIFFDSISEALKERIDDNQGYRLSGRLVYLPYYDANSNGRYLVHTGAGILFTDDRDNRVRFRTRPDIHEGPFLIDSGILDATSYTSANLEFATVLGPLSVQSELFLTNVNMAQESSQNLSGGYVYASYFLTGENRIYEFEGQHGPQFGRNVPYTNFFCVDGCHGSGAWELKARLSYLDLDAVDSGYYHDLTVGFNWYWTERIRMMFDWIHPITTADTVFGATTSNILGTRLDVNW